MTPVSAGKADTPAAATPAVAVPAVAAPVVDTNALLLGGKQAANAVAGLKSCQPADGPAVVRCQKIDDVDRYIHTYIHTNDGRLGAF